MTPTTTERKFKSSGGLDVNLRKIHADVDGAGRADVGHGADVGDLVDGAHQLVVGDRGHIVQLKNRQYYVYTDRLTVGANLNLATE